MQDYFIDLLTEDVRRRSSCVREWEPNKRRRGGGKLDHLISRGVWDCDELNGNGIS